MTIRTRLLLSFMAAALITLAVGSTGWIGLRAMSRDLDEIHDVRLPSIAALDKVNFERMVIRAQTLTVQTVPQWKPETPSILRAVAQQRAKSWQAVEEALRIYEPLPQTVEEAGVYRQFQQEYRAWRAIYVQLDRLIAEMRQTVNSEQYTPLYGHYQAVVAAMIPISERMDSQLIELIAINQRIADQAAIHANAASEFAQVLSAILIAAGLALSTLIGWTTSRAITRTIGGEPAQMAALTQRVGHGDLTVRFSHTGRETGVYAAMRDMATQLKTTVAQVLQATHQVSSAAQQIAQGSTDLAQRTEEQASALEETASSMEQLTSTVKQSADNAGQANQLATAARTQAEQGGQVVEQAIVAMSAIHQSSRKIADIIGVIDEIAFQTNLLALNATVEAARAGEQGRGFTVVAGEVRKLAQRSADAAKQIKNLINASVIQVEEGGRLVGQSGLTLQEIVGAVKKVSDIVAEIAAATREQASGIEQVNRAILQMDQATQQNAALVEQTAAASHAMGDQAVQLQELMRFFTLPEQSSDSPLKVVETSSMVSAPAMPPAAAVNRRHHHRPRVAAKQSAPAERRPVSIEGGWEKF